MSLRMSFKWQVPIGRSVLIPFKRRIYSMGLTQVILESHQVASLDVLHIVTDPCASKAVVWLNDSKCLNCVKSFVTQRIQKYKKPSVIEQNWLRNNVTHHKIDLSPQTLTFTVKVYNQVGDLIDANGYCVFDMC